MAKTERMQMMSVHCGEKKVTLGILRTKEMGYSFCGAYPFIEGIARECDARSLRPVSPSVAESALCDQRNRALAVHAWLSQAGNFPVSLIAYEKGNRPFENEIIFGRTWFFRSMPLLVMETGRYRGLEGAALLVTDLRSSDMRISRGRPAPQWPDRIVFEVPESRILPVKNFPRKSGWYMLDAQGAPCESEEFEIRLGGRHFERLRGPYVGPLIRNGNVFGGGWSGYGMRADSKAQQVVGLVLEVSENDAARMLSRQGIETVLLRINAKQEQHKVRELMYNYQPRYAEKVVDVPRYSLEILEGPRKISDELAGDIQAARKRLHLETEAAVYRIRNKYKMEDWPIIIVPVG